MSRAGRASVSIPAWVHGIFMVSGMACSFPSQLQLLPHPTPICIEITQPDILTSSDRWKHAVSPCHPTALIPPFQCTERPSMCHPNNHLALLPHVYQYCKKATHSFFCPFNKPYPRSPKGQSLKYNHKHASPVHDLSKVTSLTPSIWVASWPSSNLLCLLIS